MLGFGDNGSLALGADGGPISTYDQFDTSFATGDFINGDKGGGLVNQMALIMAGVAIGIIVLWLFVLKRS
jgi:hypothetical protein